jgi:hypothetical protein
MSSLPLKVLAAALAATFAFALPADAAKARKHKRVAAAPNTVQTSTGVRTCFLRGPFISAASTSATIPTRISGSKLWRDISGRFGGSM